MKRMFLIASVAALGTGCVVVESDHHDQYACDDPGTITIYWEFQRNTQDRVLTYNCAQAGVAAVELWIDGIREYSGSCSDARGVEGIAISGYLAYSSHNATLIGVDSANRDLFYDEAVVDTETCNVISVRAIPGDLTIGLDFVDQDGVPYAGCTDAQVDTVRYFLYDSYGTLVKSEDVTCTDPIAADLLPSFDIYGLDVGSYTLAPIQGIDSSGVEPVATFQDCTASANHFQTADSITVTLDEGVACTQ